MYVENGTDEWLQQVENGIVTSCSRTGGLKGWQLFCISRWYSRSSYRFLQYGYSSISGNSWCYGMYDE